MCQRRHQPTSQGFTRAILRWRTSTVSSSSPSSEDVSSALDCALAIKAGFDSRIEERRKRALRVRIGLAAAELVVCPRKVVDALQRGESSKSAVGTEAIVEVERRRKRCQTL